MTGMFGWLRGSLRAGDGERVTRGPYAGRDGVVSDVGADGQVGVYIDECCQPRLPASSVRRRRSRRDVGRAVRDAKESDVEGEIARSSMDGRDLGSGF